jgi:hypothetical protein
MAHDGRKRRFKLSRHSWHLMEDRVSITEGSLPLYSPTPVVIAGWYWMGIGLVLDWSCIGPGSVLDRSWIGPGSVLDWYWIGTRHVPSYLVPMGVIDRGRGTVRSRAFLIERMSNPEQSWRMTAPGTLFRDVEER